MKRIELKGQGWGVKVVGADGAHYVNWENNTDVIYFDDEVTIAVIAVPDYASTIWKIYYNEKVWEMGELEHYLSQKFNRVVKLSQFLHYDLSEPEIEKLKILLSKGPLGLQNIELQRQNEFLKKRIEALEEELKLTQGRKDKLEDEVNELYNVLREVGDINERGGPGSRKKVRNIIQAYVDICPDCECFQCTCDDC